MNNDHHRVSVLGKTMGANTARIAELGLEILKGDGLDGIETPGLRKEMCPSCACLRGTVPNGCAQTQLDFLKAVIDGVRFRCHAPNNGQMCAGYARARAFHVKHPLPEVAHKLIEGWEFTKDEE